MSVSSSITGRLACKAHRLAPIILPLLLALLLLLVGGCASSPYSTFNEALALAREGKLQQAENAFLIAITEDAGNAEAWNQLGIIAFEQKRYQLALDRFSQAYEIDPLNSAYLRNIAMSHAQLDQLAIAKEWISRALRIDPGDADSWVVQAKIALLREQYDPAREAVARALQLEPDHKEALSLLTYLQSGPAS